MKELLIEMGITFLLGALREITAGDKQKKKEMKKVFLKIHNTTKLAYPDDPDFNA